MIDTSDSLPLFRRCTPSLAAEVWGRHPPVTVSSLRDQAAGKDITKLEPSFLAS